MKLKKWDKEIKNINKEVKQKKKWNEFEKQNEKIKKS